ncbi:MAG: type II toxin-antitoxin system VapC family toxin [Rhizobiaceae bacterium]
MNGLFLLDTNILSVIALDRSKKADERFVAATLDRVVTSVLVEGELLCGLALRPDNRRLRDTVLPLLAELTVLEWTRSTAETYGRLRAGMQQLGKALSPLDMLIAAHAIEVGATLVSNDRAFTHVPGLTVEDWTA